MLASDEPRRRAGETRFVEPGIKALFPDIVDDNQRDLPILVVKSFDEALERILSGRKYEGAD